DLFWSGVYYVDDGGIAADPALGGELEFMDPRGAAPAMYAPQLAFGTPGGLSGGACESIPPRAGRLVMFPSWLLHGVRPYRGTAERISIAFNLSV
ncbi:MAG: putative 2OG-Fe(II) oxygenase, partial [Reyranellaceae bacterium]